MTAGELVLMVGPAGAGKTSFCESMGWRAPQVVSLDDYREMCTDDPGSQDANPAAVEIRRLVLEARLRRGLFTVADSTSTHPIQRAALISQARRFGRPVVLVVFHTPLDACLDRQERRDRRVPEKAIRRMFADLAGDWQNLSLNADLVVHRSPAGLRLVRLSSVPPALQSAAWLDQVELVDALPWEPAYAAAAR